MDRNENLRFIIRTLLNERREYAGCRIPESITGMQALMRGLLNVRPAVPVSKAFLKAQDTELRAQLEDKGVVRPENIAKIDGDGRIRLWNGDITRLEVDAIVNAANSEMEGCFIPMHRCIDNAIHSAAGVELRLECARLMREQGRPEPTGHAKLTKGYNLPARHIIHTVGPIVRGASPTDKQKAELADCYKSCLALADAHGFRSIALCCISTGEFGFPQRLAARIAVQTVEEYLGKAVGSHLECVIFNVFKDSDETIYMELLRQSGDGVH